MKIPSDLNLDKKNNVNYSKVKISLASPEMIKSWSYGEVLKPETINYRTLRPEKDGLFCEKIFGTTRDWECFCGKFKSLRYKGVVCDRCGVEVTPSKVRRERMGHITLATPVAHIWFYRVVPSRISLILDLSIINLKSIIYYEKYIVTDPGTISGLKRKTLITEEEYYEYRNQYGSGFKAGIGAEVILEMLRDMDLEDEAFRLREKVSKSKIRDRRSFARLMLLEDFLNSYNRPEWMIMKVIPVIPPDIRPMVQLEGGRFATSDLNDLYRRIINRNNRLNKLIALKAPEIIIKNEKRMLQEAVDALLDNSRKKKNVKGNGNRPLKSLSDILKGKQGRFRQNLLGKRVDYSGRSVIVVGPELKIHQCAIPKKMALELFRPFVMRKLVERKIVYNVKSAKKLIDKEYPEVWNILEECVQDHPVILNRAPTLHRLGMQAFEPVISSGKAIRLHPLVCAAYNADFDGDQMAVHIPLSTEAQIEAWTLMLSPLNLLDPANGSPIVNPSQDIVLGIYNLTQIKKDDRGEGHFFSSLEEIQRAYENGVVELQAEIKVNYNNEVVTTTLGRLIFSSLLPQNYDNRLINKVLTDSDLNELISDVYKKCGTYETVIMLDKVKDAGFYYSTLFADTIALEDILIPEKKYEIIHEAQQKSKKNTEDYLNGILTDEEKFQKNISLWTFANEQITHHMMDVLEKDQNGHNSLYLMATSGARGSKQQIRQLAGMRGLMAKPSGEIIDMPIVSNFKEGLGVLEYFISTHGARKGLSDTALKTADAGYLTRKLVDIAQDVTISLDDCGTIVGIDVYPIKVGDEFIEKISERVVGRYSAEDIINPFTEEIILEADTLIDESVALQFDQLEIEKVKIRTVITCDALQGICQKCYGVNLATGRIVDIGETVGIIASQSIGQPGTQLTMRTFHIGGTASSEIKDPFYKAPFDAVLLKIPDNLVEREDGKKVVARRGFITLSVVVESWHKDKVKKLKFKSGDIGNVNDLLGENEKGDPIYLKKSGMIYIDEQNKVIAHISTQHQHPLEIGAVFKKAEGEFIKKDEIVYTFDNITEPLIAEINGIVRYQDVILNKTLKEEVDEMTGVTTKRIITPREEELQPKLIITDVKTNNTVEVDIPINSNLMINDGEEVKKGQSLSGRIRMSQTTVDITGGLPRVQILFEARTPSNSAVIAEIDGEIEVGETKKGKRAVYVKNEYGDQILHMVPSGKTLLVRTGDKVKCGEPICEGLVNSHDILRVMGETSLYLFILENVQEVYKRQGVNINDKHIGVIVRQMLRKVEVVDPGDTSYIKGELVDKYIIRRKNEIVFAEGGQPAVVRSILLGLTKASLNTDSFISSASFQETSKVLSNASIKSSEDLLYGLKENVIVGKKIPAGTGKAVYDNVIVYKNIPGDLDYIMSEEMDT